MAAAPRRVFDRVAHWITGDDPARREIALAAHTQRRYAPATPDQYSTLMLDGPRIHCVRYGELGVVLAAQAGVETVMHVTERVFRAAHQIAEREEGVVFHSLEVVVPPYEAPEFSSIRPALEELIR